MDIRFTEILPANIFWGLCRILLISQIVDHQRSLQGLPLRVCWTGNMKENWKVDVQTRVPKVFAADAQLV